MDFLEKLRSASPLRIFGVALVVLVGLAFVLWLLSFLVQSVGVSTFGDTAGSAPSFAKQYAEYDSVEIYDSARDMSSSIAPVPPAGGGAGADLEEYEARSFSAEYRKQRIGPVCDTIDGLKPLPHVVFEQASRSDFSCSYTFKVDRAWSDEILAGLERLDPEHLTANTETIKRTLEVYTSRQDILLRRQELAESSLTDAVAAYDALLTLATRVEDVESVADILDNKLAQIDKLTNRRLQIAQELEQLDRSIAEAQDRIKYVSFSVWVMEDKVIDGDALAESWKNEAKRFAFALNDILHSLTFGLLENLLRIVLLLIYLLIVLFFAKYGWRFVREFWRT